MSTWATLPDRQRPRFPYREGLTLTIRPHVPPPPFGPTGYTQGSEREIASFEEVAKFTHSEWCLHNPLVETPPHPDAANTQTLEIVQCVACKNGRGVQVVRCHLGDDKDRSYTAKIYDPLYYPIADREFGTPIDVTYRADEHYSREAAAFEDLMAVGVDGKFTPKYHGSWTFQMPFLGTSELRSVRLVLLEWLDGEDLWSIMERDGENCGIHTTPPEERLEIFAKAAEASAHLEFHGVNHRSLLPRDVMVLNQDADEHQTRVLLINLHFSVCMNRPNYRDREYHLEYPLPISPRCTWWGHCPVAFVCWLPDPHRCDEAVFNGWLEQRWPATRSSEYCEPRYLRPRGRAAKLIAYASPVEDTRTVFAHVYRRYYPPSSSDDESSPSEVTDSGESVWPQSDSGSTGSGSTGSGSETDGTIS
ncbi:hypothetical protein N0V84_012255 [Fusarium piperis]|uniref:Protein kinase domain-containing protein n=1 Tax=Fusarium piperis TaxID=1435070 RepID=A0A9W8TAE9_9HYPO|nr:hypothetical protein N0V84_012255 [Fusarium piperis]